MIVAHFIDDLVTPTAQQVQMRDSLFAQPCRDWLMRVFKLDLDNLLRRKVVERQVRALGSADPEMQCFMLNLFSKMEAAMFPKPRTALRPRPSDPGFADWFKGVKEWKYRHLMVSQLSKMGEPLLNKWHSPATPDSS